MKSITENVKEYAYRLSNSILLVLYFLEQLMALQLSYVGECPCS